MNKKYNYISFYFKINVNNYYLLDIILNFLTKAPVSTAIAVCFEIIKSWELNFSDGLSLQSHEISLKMTLVLIICYK